MADVCSVDERALFAERSRRLLIARSRLGLWILLTFILLFSLADFLFNPGGFDAAQIRQLTALRLAQVLCLPVLFTVLRRCRTLRQAIAVTTLFVGAFDASIALAGIVVHDTVLAPTVLMGTNMFSAAFLPWGPWAQLIVVIVSALCIIANVVAVSDSLVAIFGYNQLESCAVLAASVWVAANLHRQRLDVFLSQRARDAAMTAQLVAARVADGLARVGREMIEAAGSAQLTERMCAVTAEVLGCGTVRAYLSGIDGEGYIPVAAHGETAEQWETVRLLRMSPQQGTVLVQALNDDDVVEIAARGAGSVLGKDLAVLLQPAGVTRSLFMALRRGSDVVGMLQANDRSSNEPFSGEQRRIAGGIAHLASMTIEHARVQAELERANRVKDHFVATLSHELRNPIGAIRGYLDLLLDDGADPLTDEQTDYVRRADQRTRELNDLITATLDLSRFEARRVPIDVQAVHVADLIDELKREIPLPDGPNAVRLEWRLEHERTAFHSDPLKLKMILRNLVTNALKFTEQGMITVSAVPRAGGMEFRVVDTGMGIAADKLATIFEPFTQAHGIQSRRKGGAGLGLHLVRRLVDVLGGTVDVASEVGRGTTFSVWVPQQTA